MQRIVLSTVSLFMCVICFGQTPKYMIDIEVGFLMYKNDSVKFQNPKTLSISTSGCTEIISLGRSRKYEFGMRVEILPSKLYGNEKYLVGKIYYVKTGKDWEVILTGPHAEWEVKPIAQRENPDAFMMGGASNDVPAFDVRLNDRYYKLQ